MTIEPGDTSEGQPRPADPAAGESAFARAVPVVPDLAAAMELVDGARLDRPDRPEAANRDEPSKVLSEDEAGYVRAARAQNTMRGYRSDWREFCSWCADHDRVPIPAAPLSLSTYLSDLAAAGATVGTMSRRRSAIRFVHTMHGHTDPCDHPRVIAVWEGIRRTHGRPPEQALPLMPPLLFKVLDACPAEKHWKTNRPPEPDLAGARDRALLLVGFVGALRRSELAALTLADVRTHPEGLVLALPRSKTNQHGLESELVILPRSTDPDYCPVVALEHWLTLAGVGPLPHEPDTANATASAGGRDLADDGTQGFIDTSPSPTPRPTVTDPPPGGTTHSAHRTLDGADQRAPLFQGVTKGNRATGRPLHPESINTLVQNAVARTGRSPAGYSAHSLRAGFVTYAHLRGATDRAIAHQTRHRSMASLGQYIRVHTAWTDNAATTLGL